MINVSLLALSFILTAIAPSDERRTTAVVDYDVNIHFEGQIKCKKCSNDAAAEISVLSGVGNKSTSTLVGKTYTGVNKQLDLHQNYSWGQRVSEENSERAGKLDVFVFVPGCRQREFRYELSKLPFQENEFLIDLGEVEIECAK